MKTSVVVFSPRFFLRSRFRLRRIGFLSETEERFFGGIKNFKKNYLKHLGRKEYK